MEMYLVGEDVSPERLGFLNGVTVFSAPGLTDLANRVAELLDSRNIILDRFNKSFSQAMDLVEYLTGEHPAVVVADPSADWLRDVGVPASYRPDRIVKFDYDGDLNYEGLF